MSTKRLEAGWFARAGLFLVGVGLFASGLGYLLRGQAFYQNYWGGAVFDPIVILIGGVVIYLALFRFGSKQKPRTYSTMERKR
jgi:hypothetical protein